jgi:multisubunit Na+/H+ antiporter MnhE subunit
VVTHAELSWAAVTLGTIWGAAALPLVAHLLVGRQTARRAHGSIPGR